MSRLELLEKVNNLNMHAVPGQRFWTTTVLYNTVIWCGGLDDSGEPFSRISDVVTVEMEG